MSDGTHDDHGPGDQIPGDHGIGDHGTGNHGTGNQGTGNQGTGGHRSNDGHRAGRRASSSRHVLVIAGAVVALVVAVVAVVTLTSHHSHPTATKPTSATTSSPTPTPTASSSAATPGGPLPPKTGAYLGAWVEPDPFSQPERVAAVQKFETLIGANLRIVHLYRKWTQPVGTTSDLAFAKRGSYLLLSWATPDLNDILSGSQDKLIAERADQIKALPTKVFLEIRWEMDRPNLKSVVHNGPTYIAAWNHIRAIFAAQKVDNVGWTWCPTAGGFDNGTANAYYPGDADVDWICADVYPKTPYQDGDNESFPTLMKAFTAWAQKHPTKPILIGEFAVSVSYGTRRGPWITAAEQYIMAHPQIKAVAWFDQSHAKDPTYYQYALKTGDAVTAFSKLAQNPYFQPQVP